MESNYNLDIKEEKDLIPLLENAFECRFLNIEIPHLESIPDLHQLTWLYSVRITSEKPLDLRNWKIPPSIRHLQLISSDLQLPDLRQIPGVQTMILEGLASFSEDILQVASLVTLRLKRSRLSSFNYDWSALVNLRTLDLRENNVTIDSFLFISDLPKLVDLNVEGNTLANRYILINTKKIPLTFSQSFFNDSKPKYDEVLAFGAPLAKISCPDALKHEFFDHFWETGELIQFSTENNERLTYALNIAYQPLKKLINEYLDHFIESRNGAESLTQQSVIYIVGKTIEPVSKIKEAITSLGARHSTKLTSEVTHIIVGKNPDNIDAFNNNKYLYLYERNLFDLTDKEKPKFIVAEVEKGNTDVLSGVAELLNSPEPVNINIGLQMLQTGGVPDEILDVILMLAKSNPDTKVRAEAKKILSLQAPPSWRALIEDKQLFKNLNEEVKEQDIFNKLKLIEKDAGFDSAALLSFCLYRRYKKGLRFMLMAKEASEDQQKRTYQLLMSGGELDFSTGLGFKNWKNTKPEEMSLYTHKIKFPFPVDVLKWYRVTSINFHNCKFSSIPKELQSFKEIEKLDFSCNHLTALPAHLEKLQTLEELDLSSNNFKEFPASIVKLKNLRRVDLRHRRLENAIVPLVLPDEIKQAMRGCEILV